MERQSDLRSYSLHLFEQFDVRIALLGDFLHPHLVGSRCPESLAGPPEAAGFAAVCQWRKLWGALEAARIDARAILRTQSQLFLSIR